VCSYTPLFIQPDFKTKKPSLQRNTFAARLFIVSSAHRTPPDFQAIGFIKGKFIYKLS